MIPAEKIEQIENMLRGGFSRRTIAEVSEVSRQTVDAVAGHRITSASERRKRTPTKAQREYVPSPRTGNRVWRCPDCGHKIVTKTCIECEAKRLKASRRVRAVEVAR